MKLILGSAQLGFKYGYKKKKINKKQYSKIINLIKKNSLIKFDTAMSYGESEKILGTFKFNKQIITKIKLPKSKQKNYGSWINNKINTTLNRLKVKKIYALLIHDTSDILYKDKTYLNFLKDLKKKRIISKLGISVYDVEEVQKILKFWKPDIIQMPINVFDQRFLKKNFLNKLKRLNIEIHARSCFLQGLLLETKLNKGNNSSKKLFTEFLRWCKYKKISQLTACLHFLKQIKDIKFIVVGFENSNHLKEIIKSYNKKLVNVPYYFSNSDKTLVDPRKW